MSNIKNKLRLKAISFLLWLDVKVDVLLERYDRCCYPGCKEQAFLWCITGGHRHCYDHESHFYSDVDMCMVCKEQMTPEEIKEIEEQEAEWERLNYEEPFLP